MSVVTESFAYRQLSATANVKSSQGMLGGVFCSSSSGATVAIYDDAAAGTTTPIVQTFNLSAGTFYPLPAGFAAGCNVVIAGTAQITVFYK